MKRSLGIAVTTFSFLTLFALSFAQAQNSLTGIIGNPTDATRYTIPGVGFINLSSGNLHIEIPLNTVKDRNNSSYAKTLIYDSSGYDEVQVPYGTSTYGAWAAFPIAHVPYINDWNSGVQIRTLPAYGGGVNWRSTYLSGCTAPPPSQCASGYTYTNWQFVDSGNTVHPFDISATTADSSLSTLGYTTAVQAPATDGSGYWLVVTNSTSATVYDVHGNIVYPVVKDTNGNYGGDRLGRSISYLPTGWISTYKTIYIWTKFNVGPQEIGLSASGGQGPTSGAIAVSVLQYLQDPDGREYVFTYDDAGPPQGPNGTFLPAQQGHYGTLTGITLPTGAQIALQMGINPNWAGGSGSLPILVLTSVQTPDGTWSLSYVSGQPLKVTAPPDRKTGLASQTTCICPSGGGTQTISTYAGSATGTPLRKTVVQYSGPGRPGVITTTLDGAVTSKVTYSYADLCTPRISSKKEYDYSGSLIRDTEVTFYTTSADNTGLCQISPPSFSDVYLKNGHHIADIPQSITVYGPSGCCSSPVAQTNFSYDTTFVSDKSGSALNLVTGMTQLHDDANFGTGMTTRGNLTAVSQMVSPGVFVPTQTNYYNILGELIETDDGRNKPTKYDYTDHWNPNTSACITYTSFAYPTTVTNALGQTTTSTYNSCDGSVASATDANSQTTSYTYDSLQRVKTIANPDNGGAATSTMYYSQIPTPYTSSVFTESGTQAGQRFDLSIHDGLGRETDVISNSLVHVHKTYDSLGRLASVTNPYYTTGDATYGVTNYYYDALGRKTSQVDADGVSTQTWLYYANLSTFADEVGNQWQQTRDPLGRLLSVLEPSGASQAPTLETDYTYDPLDNLVQVDQYGGPKVGSPYPERQRKFSYDAMSRLTQAYNPESGWTCYGATSPVNSSPNGSNCTAAYDGASNLTNKTDARGVSIGYTYDDLNRLTQKLYSDSTPTVKYGYDGLDVNGVAISPAVLNAKGRLSQSTAAVLNVSSTYSYDKMGRIASKKACIPGDCAGHVSIAATYDLMGNTLTLNNGLTNHAITWTNVYDSLSRLQTMTASTAIDSMTKLFDASSTSSYGAEGLENALFGYNSTTSQNLVTYQHRSDNRLRTIYGGYLNSSGAVLYSYCMPGSGNSNCSATGSPYTANSNLSKVNDFVTGNWVYNYDTLNRLSNGTANSGPNSGKTACWVYDPFGNRTSESLSTTACNSNPPKSSWADYSTTNSNRMDSTNNNLGQQSGYDSAGNVRADGLNTYLYDAEGRICFVGNSSQVPISGYIYDGDGNRVGKYTPSSYSCASPSSITAGIVVGLGGEQLSEITGSGFWDHSNAFAKGQLLATYKSTHLYFSLNDWLGTRRAEVSGSGCSSTTYANLPFGNALTTTGGCPYTTEQHFTGKERDSDSGNDYFGARYYTAAYGRFLSADPLLNSGRPSNPQSWNRYSYGFNNPLSVVDPTGLYNLPANCLQDIECSKIAAQLKSGLEALNKALDDPKIAGKLGSEAVARLSEGLAAFGTENDGNNVNVQLGAVNGGAMQTDPKFDGSNSYSGFTVTIDPNKAGNGDAVGLAINADHEGQHIWDFNNYMLDKAHTESPFQWEYRAYQNTSWAAQAFKLDHRTMISSHGNFEIWNSSWRAVDQQTMRDRAITNLVRDDDHPETPIHNPNTP